VIERGIDELAELKEEGLDCDADGDMHGAVRVAGSLAQLKRWQRERLDKLAVLWRKIEGLEALADSMGMKSEVERMRFPDRVEYAEAE
jgi:hypothetical protein